jgi:multiple sugar transport system permease protein
MPRSDRKELLKGLAFISPWLIGFTAFTLLPVILSLYFSFCDYPLVVAPVYRGTENYRMMFNDDLFWKALGNTFYYAAMAMPAAMIVALIVAMLLNAKIRGQSIYRTIIFLPSLVPIAASSMIWLWLFNTKLGLINLILLKLGVSNPPGWLSDPKLAMPSLAFMSLWSVGQTVVIYLAGLQDVPTELYEAAEIDGASAFGKVWHVTLPAISPVIFFNLIMGIIGTFQIFAQPYMMTNGGGPNRATYFYTLDVYNNAFRYLRMGYASALGWIQLLIILALTALAFWSSKRWVHTQGK